MFIRLIRNRKLLALGLGAALAAVVAGCGGQPTDSSDVNVVVPEPNVNVSSKTTGASAPTTATGTTGAPAPESSASTAGTSAGGWGTLKGQVVFTGTPPPEKVLEEKGKAEKDPDMCAVAQRIVSERIVIDAATKGVKNVLVYLPRPTAVNDDAKKAVLAKPMEFDQKQCVFEPHVLGLMTGTTVTIKSSDPKSHNVNIKLKKTLFNQPIGAGNPVKLPLQDAENTPGAVVCDIHPWMTSWWMVLNHPYFAVTDEKGNYEIKNAPAGNQKVVVWQEFVKGGGFVTPSSGEIVDIKANDTTPKDFTIDSGKLLPVN
jgi:plastocyanin